MTGALRRLADRVSGMIDPNAAAAGPPPTRFLPFMGWSVGGAWGVFRLAMLAQIALAGAEVGAAWLVAWAVDLVAEAGPRLTSPEARAAFLSDHALALIAAGVFVMLARPICMAISSGLMSLSLQPGMFQLTLFRLHRHTLGQSLKYFEDDFAGRISQKQLQTGNAVTELLSEVVQAVSFALATLIAAVIALSAADGRLGWVLGVWLAAYVGWISFMLPRLRSAARERADAQSGLSGQLVDTISHMETVKLFA
ncbi:MAG: ABC transporter transmembrane domain-containing protein, partial [Pseudomonadota bacterium]